MPFNAHPTPRAGVDPILDAATAWSVLSLATSEPPHDETVVMLLDHERCGLGLVVVSGTRRPDDVLDVVDCLTRLVDSVPLVGGLVLVSVRPTAPFEDADADRWLEMSAACDAAGTELIEWFVDDGSGPMCPRDLLGEVPRWS